MSAFAVLKDAWLNRDKLGDGARTRELAAFLPAALEIQEAPPNPIARWLAWSLLCLMLIGIVWAAIGQLNIVASAEGKIIPSSRVKQIQALQKSAVKHILVSEGEMVSKGQALVELDATATLADQHRLSGELNRIESLISVNESLLSLLKLTKAQQRDISFSNLSLATDASPHPSNSQLYAHLLWQRWQQYYAERSSLESSLDKTIAEKAVNKELVIKLEQTLPIIKTRTERMNELYKQNFASEIDFLNLEQERITHVQDLEAERQRGRQLNAAQREITQKINALTAQTIANTLTELSQLKQQADSLSEELKKAVNLNSMQTLYAPVSGQVQELNVHTVGGVVTEAQQLMLIVPDEEQLEVEVFLENKDIGFVHQGMSAEIKIHTFPFTKYGVIDAEVVTISDDATLDEHRGLVYGMRLRLSKNTLWVEGKEVKLIAGMAVTAEMKIGERKIMEFFLAPLLKHSSESLRER